MSSRALYGGDGVTSTFLIPFPYIKRPDVVVRVNTVVQLTPLDYDFVDDTHVKLKQVPAPADAVELFRQTDASQALAQFHDGSILTEAELNLAVTQLLYLIQEQRDALDATINTALARVATNSGISGGDDILANATLAVLQSQLLADLQSRITDIDTNAATIMAQVDRANTLTDQVNNLKPVIDAEVATFITDEQTARINGDTAINETISLMGAKSGDSLSFVFDLDTVKVSPTESMAERFSGLQSSIGDNAATIASESTTRVQGDAALSTRIDSVVSSVGSANAAITNEASTRATADSAMSDQLNVVQSTVNANTSAITSEATTRSNADGALSTRVDGILAMSNNNTALILSEQTARANGDSANASSIDTLQTSVSGNTASIATQQTSLNGVLAEYTVKIDVNGHVAGYGLIGNQASSVFAVSADQFVIAASGTAQRTEYSTGNWRVYDSNNVLRVRLGVW